MTSIEIGTKLIVSPTSEFGPPPHTELQRGDEVKVVEVQEWGDDTLVRVTGGGSCHWDLSRFELAPEPEPVVFTNVTIIPDDVSVFDLPRRPYDFNLGDRRFTEQDDAVQWSYDEALRTGRRRMVRLDSSPEFTTLYVSQEIGS